MYTLTSLVEGLPTLSSRPVPPQPPLRPASSSPRSLRRPRRRSGDPRRRLAMQSLEKSKQHRGLRARGFKPAYRTPIVRQGRWRDLSTARCSTGRAAPGGGPCRTPSVRQVSVSNASRSTGPSRIPNVRYLPYRTTAVRHGPKFAIFPGWPLLLRFSIKIILVLKKIQLQKSHA